MLHPEQADYHPTATGMTDAFRYRKRDTSVRLTAAGDPLVPGHKPRCISLTAEDERSTAVVCCCRLKPVSLKQVASSNLSIVISHLPEFLCEENNYSVRAASKAGLL